MISDDECVARGGHVETERDVEVERERPIAPFRICRFPNAAVGKTCLGDGDCNGARCMCTGALARPNPRNDPALVLRDHTAGTGECHDGALPNGSWFCLVEGGVIEFDGIIVD